MPKTGKQILDENINWENNENLAALSDAFYNFAESLYENEADMRGNFYTMQNALFTIINENISEEKIDNAMVDLGKLQRFFSTKAASGETYYQEFKKWFGDDEKLDTILNELGEKFDIELDFEALENGEAYEEPNPFNEPDDEELNNDNEDSFEDEPLDKETVLKKLKDLEAEGDFREIIEFSAKITYRQVMGEDVGEATDAIIEWQESWFDRSTGHFLLKEEKWNDYIKFAEEVGKYSAELQIKHGKEKEAFAEKIRNGEIPGTESVREDEDAIWALTDAYADNNKNYETGGIQTILSQAFQTFNTDAHSTYSDVFRNKLLDATRNQVASTEGMTRDEAEKAFVHGAVRGRSEAAKYGFKDNPNAGKNEEPYFLPKEINEKKTLINNLNKDELDKLEKKTIEQGKKYSNLMDYFKDVHFEATQMLASLETMTKAGHQNSKEYNNMHDALERITKMSEYTQPGTVGNAFEDLKKTSKKFEETHSSFFRARWGYGNDRRNMSIKLQEFATKVSDDFEKMEEGINMGKSMKISVDECSAKVASIDKQKAKFKVSHNEIKNEEGINDNKDKKTQAVKNKEQNAEKGISKN